MARTTTGIDVRHGRTCPAARNPDARCRCSPSYQAHVWSARDQKRIRKTFPTLAEAKAWRAESLVALHRGTMRAPTAASLRQVWEAWLNGARAGTIRNRSGDAYKPSVLRGKEAGLQPIGLHEARHTFASILIAAGVNAKALSTYLGHSSIQITLDRYGHLMPGNEDEAVALVDAYLERATGPTAQNRA